MSDNTDIQIASGPGGNLHEMPMVIELAELFGTPAKSLINLMSTQIIKVPKNDPPATPGELMYALSVMRQYRLNPMLKQVHAWRDKRGDLCVMAGVDGWIKYANERPTFKRVEYKYGEMCDTPDKKGKRCWEYITVTVVDSERGPMEMVPVFLDEWYQREGQYGPGPWQKQTRHKLHVVAYRLAIREAYGMGGLDVRDPEDFAPAQYTVAASATADRADQLAAQLAEAKQPTVHLTTAGKEALMEAAETGQADPVAVAAILEESFWTCPLCQTENDGAECVRCGSPLLPPDEPESAQGHMLIDPPKSRHEGACAAVGCIKAWSLRCAMCGERFCTEHMHENRIKCKVCGGGE
jgi:hypothetical protein